MTTDFLYERPPLSEVIVEVHWTLSTLEVIPGAAIDPNFPLFHEQISRTLVDLGFSHIEQLRPPEAPIEFFGGKVTHRHRRQANHWPLYQYGPGVFAANIVPPYDGWMDFRSSVTEGLKALYSSYPSARDSIRVKDIQLRYIDAFGEHHGFDDYASFVKNNLAIDVSLPDDLFKYADRSKGLESRLEFVVPLSLPESSTGVVKIGPGTAKGKPAAVMEMIARAGERPNIRSVDDILEWLDLAHITVAHWFDSICTANLKKTFGSKTSIE